MDDYDEDVLFDNSHLFKYLKDAGVTGIDVEAIATPCSSSIIDQSRTNIDDHNIRKSRWTWSIFTNTAWRAICAIYCFEVGFQESSIKSWRKDAFLTLAHSSLLEEDDSDFLENYYQESEKQCMTPESSKSRITISVTILLCSYIIQRLLNVRLVWGLNTLFDAVAVLMIIHIVFSVKKFIQSFWMKQFLSNKMKSIILILEQFEMNSSLVKKSLRLIQETELVARGFTLVSRQCPVSRLEENNLYNSQRKCPELRKTIFAVSKTCMLSFKESTLKVLHASSFSSEEDSKSQCLALIPIEEYGPCLQVNGENSNDETELKHLTDNYSLSALKAMFHLYYMQQSEFIRIWASHFLSGDILKGHIEVKDILSIVTNTSKCINDQHAALQRCYTLQRCYVLNKDHAKTKAPRSLTVSNVDCFQVAVHSLDLHLQSALTRIRALADEVEQHQRISEVDSTLEEKWTTAMKAVNAEMHACRGCYDEGILRLGCIFKKVQQPASIPQVKLNVCPPNFALPTTLIDLEGPVFEDQVFEAFTDAETVEDSGWSDFENLLSPEEKAKKKQEKEEALRLLSELRTVISVRARDREEREDRALGLRQSTAGMTYREEREGRALGLQQSTAGMTDISPQQSHTNIADKSSQISCVNRSDDNMSGLLPQQTTSNEICISEHDMQIVDSGVCSAGHAPCCDCSKESKSCQIVQSIHQYNSISDDASSTLRMNCEATKKLKKYVADQNQDTGTSVLESNIEHGRDYSDAVSKELQTSHICEDKDDALLKRDNKSTVRSKGYSGKTNVLPGCDLDEMGSFPIDRTQPDIFSAGEHDVVKRSSAISDVNLLFTSSLALMAAAKSQSMPLQEETFGDSDENSDIDEENCCT